MEELLRVQIGAKDVLINDFHKTNKSIIREQLLLFLADSNQTYLEIGLESMHLIDILQVFAY